MAGFPGFWQHRGFLSTVLLPLSVLYGTITAARRSAYRLGLLRSQPLPYPVIVVGNIFVGGTGKTPMVAWLVERLAELGHRPGIISRGYGGSSRTWPLAVRSDSDPRLVGDEPVLLATRCGCPVVVGPDRVAAGRKLLAENSCDVIISDDGLQHYRLHRDLEIAVLDAERGIGNGYLLPAGPLREPVERLKCSALVIGNGGPLPFSDNYFRLLLGEAINLRSGESRPLTAQAFPGPVHAAAGIGNPGRFFGMLEEKGLQIIPHPFADHYAYEAGSLDFDGDSAVLITEKDAVKYRRYATGREWYVPARAEPAAETERALNGLLAALFARRAGRSS